MRNDSNSSLNDIYETIHLCEKELAVFIQGRIHDINQGRECPYLSAAFIKKYASGMAMACSIAYGSPLLGQVIIKSAESKLDTLIPGWREREEVRILAKFTELNLM